MNIEVFGMSDVGLRRERNEDSYLMERDLGLYIVADGMGGHVGGDFASQLAVKTIKEIIAKINEDSEASFLKKHKIRSTDFASQLRCSIQVASNKIYKEARKNPEFRGMGTTAVVLMVRNGRIYVANVGDSRAYLARGSEIVQLTQDHSLVGEQLRAGVISEGAARGHKLKNIITRSVGFQEDVEIDVVTKVPRKGDRFLLCSDGLTNMVDDAEILEVVRDNDVEEACHILVDMANARGGEDNITVVLIHVSESDDVVDIDDSEDESTIGI